MHRLAWNAANEVGGRIQVGIRCPQAEPFEKLIAFHGHNSHVKEQPKQDGHGNKFQQGQQQQGQTDQDVNR